MDAPPATLDSNLLLSVDDLSRLKSILCRVQAKWYELGSSLGFPSQVLNEVAEKNTGLGTTFISAMLDVWEKSSEPPLPSWSHLIMSLKDIGELDVAHAVEEQAPNVVSKETQKATIEPLLQQPLVKGDIWYLVQGEWLKNWKRYVNFDYFSYSPSHPGPINTVELLRDDQLRDFMSEGLDFSLLPHPAWDKLVSWYGLSKGSKPIPRKVVEYGVHVKDLKVEIYLIDLCLHQEGESGEKAVTRSFSRSTTVGDLEAVVRDVFQIPNDVSIVLSSFYHDLLKSEETLGELSIRSKEKITWRKKSTSEPSNEPEHYAPSTEVLTASKRSTAGLCGLSNLGNTCFMNSALQCLSNTEPLRSYFLAPGNETSCKLYEKELNTNNPLGSGGALAKAFSKLMEEMWSGERSSVAPRQLKSEVGDFAPQFSGYGQQDSQELLAFLLDGLHEDINRVLKKPYVDMDIKSERRSDKDLADETWEKYLKRNKSFIVDLFQGQYKSTVTCPECQTVSRTFDPFMYLSLSLPLNSETLSLTVTLVKVEPSAPICKYKLRVIKQGTIFDLKAELQNVTSIQQSKMVAVKIEKSVVEAIYDDAFILTDLSEKDNVYIYGLACSVDDQNYTIVYVEHYEERIVTSKFPYKESKPEMVPFGVPLFIAVPKAECTFESLYSIIESQCRFIKNPGACANNNKEDNNGQPTTENNSGQAVAMAGNNQENTKRPSYLFTPSIFNRKGKKKKQEEFSQNGKPVVLNNNSFVSCIWNSEVKKDYYDEKMAMERHETSGSGGTVGSGQKDCELIDCFRSFSKPRYLTEDNKWHCPKCKKKVQAYKKFDIWKWPKILIIHFKRFSFGRYRRSKIEGLVKFPIKDCNLNEFKINEDEPPPNYDLFAISNHFGGLGGGHYTAYAKNSNTGHWYIFNDSHVEQVPECSVVTSAAYVLFYCHKGKDTPPFLGNIMAKETSV